MSSDVDTVITVTGIAAIGVHGRTRDERPRHKCREDYIRQVAQALRIPVIAKLVALYHVC